MEFIKEKVFQIFSGLNNFQPIFVSDALRIIRKKLREHSPGKVLRVSGTIVPFCRRCVFIPIEDQPGSGGGFTSVHWIRDGIYRSWTSFSTARLVLIRIAGVTQRSTNGGCAWSVGSSNFACDLAPDWNSHKEPWPRPSGGSLVGSSLRGVFSQTSSLSSSMTWGGTIVLYRESTRAILFRISSHHIFPWLSLLFFSLFSSSFIEIRAKGSRFWAIGCFQHRIVPYTLACQVQCHIQRNHCSFLEPRLSPTRNILLLPSCFVSVIFPLPQTSRPYHVELITTLEKSLESRDWFYQCSGSISRKPITLRRQPYLSPSNKTKYS